MCSVPVSSSRTKMSSSSSDARKALLIRNGITALVLLIAALYAEFIQTPRVQSDLPILGFDKTDRTFIAEAKISTTGLVSIILIALVVSLTVGNFVFGGKEQDDWIWGGFSLFSAVCAAILVTDIIKNTTGSYRPDFLERCLPDGNDLCTGDEEEVEEGRKSFPSGHSSVSMATLHWVSLYFAAKFRLDTNRGDLLRLLGAWAPTVIALVIGWQRLPDYRHHPLDIIAGQILGWIIANVFYSQFYPPSPLYSANFVAPGTDPSIPSVFTCLQNGGVQVKPETPRAPGSSRGSKRVASDAPSASNNNEI